MRAFDLPYLILNNLKYSTAATLGLYKHSTFLSIGSHLLHLYHSETLWFFVDLSCILGILIPHQKRLCLHLNSEVYLEHSWTSKMELFVKLFLWKATWQMFNWQSQTKLMKQYQEIKQNWTGRKTLQSLAWRCHLRKSRKRRLRRAMKNPPKGKANTARAKF